MKALGGFQATPDTFSNLAQFQNGDIVWVHPVGSVISWAIMYVTGGPWSHVGILTEGRTVIEAVTGGVIERPFAEYFDGNCFLAMKHLDEEKANGDRVVDSARNEVGKGYNYLGALRLGLLIIGGAKADWQTRFIVDVVLLSIGVLVLAHSRIVPFTLTCSYLLAVALSTPARRHDRESKAAYSS